jgi:hypothetical protein
MADELSGWRQRPADELLTFAEAVEAARMTPEMFTTLVDQGKLPRPIKWEFVQRRMGRQRVGFYSRRAVEIAARNCSRPDATRAPVNPIPHQEQ